MKRKLLYPNFRWRALHTLLTFCVVGVTAGSFIGTGVGPVALRGATSEVIMRFSDKEMQSAAARISHVKKLDEQDMVVMIAKWETITSVAEIRHLLEKVNELPETWRNGAREVLISRWLELDPDSAGLHAAQGKIVYPESMVWVRCVCRDWAAGRSADEIAGKLKSLFGDVNSFLQLPTYGEKFKLQSSPALQIASQYLNPEVIASVVSKLAIRVSPEFHQGIYFSMASSNPFKAWDAASALSDGPEKRQALLGTLGAMTLHDPAKAWKLAAQAGPQYQKELALPYLAGLAKQDAAQAAKEAVLLMETGILDSPHASFRAFDSIHLRDPAAGIAVMMQAPPHVRKNIQTLSAYLLESPETLAALDAAMSESPADVVRSILTKDLQQDAGMAELHEKIKTQPDKTTRSIMLDAALEHTIAESGDDPLAGIRSLMNERAKLPDPLFAASEFSNPKPRRRDDQEALTNVIASHWPESRSLLETLEPEARNHYLPELSIAVVQRDPAAALALVEAEGGWEKHPHSITAFAEAFAASDPTAATAWAEQLPKISAQSPFSLLRGRTPGGSSNSGLP